MGWVKPSRSAVLPGELELVEIEAFAGQAFEQGVVGFLIDLFGSGENPQIFARGFADGDQLVGVVEVDHPVVAPHKGQEGEPRRGEADFELGRVGAAHLAGGADGFVQGAVFKAAAVDDLHLTVAERGVFGPGFAGAFFLEPGREAGDFVPGAHVARHVEGGDGGERCGCAVVGEGAGRD